MSEKEVIKQIQKKVGVTADGIIGKKTIAAIAGALGIKIEASPSKKWPTQAEVRSGKSIFGKAGDESNLVNIKPPYQLRYIGKPVSTVRVHKLMAESLQNALSEVLKHYGIDEIKRLGLDEYNGCYNYRKTTNGKSLSMHAFGVAIDFCASKNGYSTKKPTATLSKPEYKAFVDIMEKHGLMSFGRKYDYDYMHFQLARF